MGHDNDLHKRSGPKRRTVLRSIGAAGVLGTTTLSGYATTGGRYRQDGDWPDLSGTTLHFLTDESNDTFREFFTNVGNAFNEATGAEVRMDYQAVGGSVEERLVQLLQSGDPPDVYMSSVSQASTLTAQGAAAPVNSAVNAVIDQYGEPRERLQYQGDDYLMPIWSNIGISWYRTDLYEEAPTTWEQSLQGAEQVSQQDGMNGAFVPAGQNFCTDLMLLGYVYSNGAVLTENQGGNVQVAMDNNANRQKWIDALAHLQNLHQYSPQNSDAGCSQMSQALASEAAAQTWYVGSRPKNQSILQNKEYAGNIAPTLQPIPQGRDNAVTNGLTDGLITFKQADNPEAAKTYMEFFAQPDYMTELAFITPLQNIVPFPGIIQSDTFQQRLENLPEVWTDEDIETTLTAAQNYKTLATESDTLNPYAGAIYSSRKLSEMMFDVTVRGNDPASVVDQYANEIQQVIDESSIS